MRPSLVLASLMATLVTAHPPRRGDSIVIPAEYHERHVDEANSFKTWAEFTNLLRQASTAMARAAFYSCPHESTSTAEWEYLLGCTEVNYDNLRMQLIDLTYWDAETLFHGNANDTTRSWSAPPEIGQTTFTKIV